MNAYDSNDEEELVNIKETEIDQQDDADLSHSLATNLDVDYE